MICGALFGFGYICTFAIYVFRKILKLQDLILVVVILVLKKLISLFLFSNSIVYCINELDFSDCRDCALVLNFKWNHQQISHQNVFGAMLKVRPCVIDMWTILWRYLNNNKKTIMDKPLGVEFNSVENTLL